MHLVKLSEYRSREVVAAIKELLEAAEAGEVRGLAYVVNMGPGDDRAGLAGEYRRFPEKALQATFALERHLARTGPFAHGT